MTASSGSIRQQNLLPVQVAAIPVSPEFRVSLHLWNAGTRRHTLYRHGGTSLGAEDLRRLTDAGITTVYLEAADFCRLQTRLRSSLHSVVGDERLAVSQRLGVLDEVVRDVLREAFQSRNIPRAVQQTGELARHLVELLCHNDFVVSEMCSVLHFDSATFTHSANVACYSVLLANSLGLSDRAILEQIGTGALLHDIGKLEVPEQILTKTGPLTPDERETIQRHPSVGLASLRNEESLNFGQLMMVYQHHERIDGTGYPVQAAGGELHEWGRICAVVDVFEALTSHRPYHRALSSDAALEFMQERLGAGLDTEFLECWKRTIGTR